MIRQYHIQQAGKRNWSPGLVSGIIGTWTMRLMSHSHQDPTKPKTKLASTNTNLRSQSILFYELYTQCSISISLDFEMFQCRTALVSTGLVIACPRNNCCNLANSNLALIRLAPAHTPFLHGARVRAEI